MNLIPALSLRVSKLIYDTGFLGYLSRNGVYSATKGALIVPASSSVGNVPTTVNIDWFGTYAIVGNTQKCFIDDPCNIPVVLSPVGGWYTSDGNSYAKSYTADGVLIDSLSDSGNLNIYGAAYIVFNGGTMWDGENSQNRTMSVADAYIDAGTSLIFGNDTPPEGPKVSKFVWDSDMAPAAGKKFSGNLTGNVAGNVTGNLTGNVTGNVTGKIIVNGCSWSNSAEEGANLQGRGLLPIISSKSVTSSTTSTVSANIYIAYPYLGVFDFRSKPTSPALTFTVNLSGTAQGESIGANMSVIAADGVTVLRTYSKYNDMGAFTFPVDLTDAYILAIVARSVTGTTVTAGINSLYVRLPYSESLVDEV